MKDRLYDSINTMAYLLWEYTKSENALDLWRCAEDMANIFEERGIFSIDAIDSILSLGRGDENYREFVRLLSYRIHKYTGELNTIRNWFITEKLLNNPEWKASVICAAEIFRSCCDLKDNYECENVIKSIRSEQIRSHYMKKRTENI